MVLVLFKFGTSGFIKSHCLLLLLIYAKKKRITLVVDLQREAMFKVNFKKV